MSRLALILSVLWVSRVVAAEPLRDGDIIFHASRSSQSLAIQRATHSPYSHMGLIVHRNGKPYDLYFEWSDQRIYCSELVWKAYREAVGIELGDRQKLRDFDLSDARVKAKMRERFGGEVPLDEPVISPAAMFDSALLRVVLSRGKP